MAKRPIWWTSFSIVSYSDQTAIFCKLMEDNKNGKTVLFLTMIIIDFLHKPFLAQTISPAERLTS
jgi:hypothetical protein